MATLFNGGSSEAALKTSLSAAEGPKNIPSEDSLNRRELPLICRMRGLLEGGVANRIDVDVDAGGIFSSEGGDGFTPEWAG